MKTVQPYEAGAAPWHTGLSVQLFALTLLSILLIEAVIFPPSASSFRTMWLTERGNAARIAALALEAAPSRMVSEELARSLLSSAEVLSVSEAENDMKTLLLEPVAPIPGPFKEVNLMTRPAMGSIMDTASLLFSKSDGYLIVTVEGTAPDRSIEYVVPQAPLKAELTAFAWRVAGISLLIGLILSTLIYIALHQFVVRPIKRVTKSVEQFRQDPGGWKVRLKPTSRRDEIGRARNALADMESAVADSFRQRTHLAELGTAVAKINHDLRNSLASAQIVSESLALSDDPRVAKAAQRIEKSLERAIRLAADTLEYGKAAPQAAALSEISLQKAAKDAVEEALAPYPGTSFKTDIPSDLKVSADREHLHRLLVNLVRNAAQAMEEPSSTIAEISLTARTNTLRVSDTGPGIPKRIKDALFTPFRSSHPAGGSGLGLVIARELAEGMGWTLDLESTGPDGTVFRVGFPEQ